MTYNSERPHLGRACRNRPPYRAFPELPYLRRLPDEIDPDFWLMSLNGRHFRRNVQANGSVRVDNRSYYVGKRFKGQKVVLQVDAHNRQFQVIHNREIIKTVAIKGLYDELLDFETYFKLICAEARTEWRSTKRLVRQRRLVWAA